MREAPVSVGLIGMGGTKLPAEASAPCLPHLIRGEFELAALIERAAGEEAGGAFDVVAHGAVAAAEGAFPERVVGAEEGEAVRADVGGKMGQRAVGGDEGFETGEPGQGGGGGF